MMKPKQFPLLLFFCCIYMFSDAQDLSWLKGTWKGVVNKHKNQSKKTLVIESIDGNNFRGTKTYEINDKMHGSIITAVSGYLEGRTFFLKTDTVLSRIKPQHGDWFDCSHCIPTNRIEVTYDSVYLISEIIGCADYCDGTSVYYKSMSDFDSNLRRSLVAQFGTPEQVTAFNATQKNQPTFIQSDPDAKKPNQDSIKNAASLEKKNQQRIQDSIDLARKQEQQRIKDSTAFAKKRQQQIDDSLKVVAANEKKRQQYIQDSLSVVKQQQQQHIRDSITNAAIALKRRQQQIVDSTNAADAYNKKRRQQIDDSLKIAEANEKKRQQQVQDSISIAKQKEQQHIQDSVTNAAIALKKRQQQMLDSTNAANALTKKRQQQIDDSLKLAAALEKKRQQHIQDSISVAKQKQAQRTRDSLITADIAFRKRQQQISDSTNAANALVKKRQQQVDDSVNNAALLAKKKQQQVQDSLNKIAAASKIKQQETEDSIKLASAKQHIADSLKTVTAKSNDKSKALTQRDNVLLQSYHINTPDILLELFDNAEIDGDRVSVFHNNEVIVNNQTLQHEPITFKIHADATNRTHEFILIAENLGTIPPNTALLRITVGTQVYKLSVKTDLKTNAKIDFFYDGN